MWFDAQFGHTGILAQFIGSQLHKYWTECSLRLRSTDYALKSWNQNKTIVEEIHFYSPQFYLHGRQNQSKQIIFMRCNKTKRKKKKFSNIESTLLQLLSHLIRFHLLNSCSSFDVNLHLNEVRFYQSQNKYDSFYFQQFTYWTIKSCIYLWKKIAK